MNKCRVLFLALTAVVTTATCSDTNSPAPAPTSLALGADATASASAGARGTTTGTVSVTGTITRLAGACPALTISVGGAVAATNRATVFDGKACVDLKVGVAVAISGSVRTGGTTLLAITVVSRR